VRVHNTEIQVLQFEALQTNLLQGSTLAHTRREKERPSENTESFLFGKTLHQIVVRNRNRQDVAENLGNQPKVTARFQSAIVAGERDEMEAQRARAQTTTANYKRPRKSTKGPTTETAKPGPLPAMPDAGKSSAPPQIPPPRSTNA
jgi:hypothetical protein